MRKSKKIMHMIAIEYPFITIFLVGLMIVVLYMICEFYSIDTYYEVVSSVNFDEESGKYIAELPVPKEYCEGIKKKDNVIWYIDLESAVYTAEIIEISQNTNGGKVVVFISSYKYNEAFKTKTNDITFKVSYGSESILDRLISD